MTKRSAVVTGRIASSKVSRLRVSFRDIPVIDEELLALSRRFSQSPPEQLVPSIDLGSYLRRLIAHGHRVDESAIDDPYMRDGREKEIYPDAVYCELNGFEGSIHGGYDGNGLEHKTRREFDEASDELDQELSRF